MKIECITPKPAWDSMGRKMKTIDTEKGSKGEEKHHPKGRINKTQIKTAEIHPSISVITKYNKYKSTKLSSSFQNEYKMKSSYKLFAKDIPKT